MRTQPFDSLLRLLTFLVALLVAAPAVHAAEGGHGVYLLGLRGTNAGITPPPGVYFANNLYIYSGAATATQTVFPTLGGQAVANVNATVILDLPSVMWSTPVDVLGGNLAFSLLWPIGGPTVNAGARLSSSLLGLSAAGAQSDSVFTLGDPAVSASIGWHAGNYHWNAALTGFVPVGNYRYGALANIANHRWAADVTGSFTWFDPKIGLDLSLAVGATFSQENAATQYKTGDEFHLEWAVTQYLSKEFSIGAVGYFYRQFTPDSGAGAVFGQFMGQVAAVGGTLGYNFKVGNYPVAARVKVYSEFAVRNRLEGTGGFFTLSMPLYVNGASTRAPDSAN